MLFSEGSQLCSLSSDMICISPGLPICSNASGDCWVTEGWEQVSPPGSSSQIPPPPLNPCMSSEHRAKTGIVCIGFSPLWCIWATPPSVLLSLKGASQWDVTKTFGGRGAVFVFSHTAVFPSKQSNQIYALRIRLEFFPKWLLLC